MDFITNLPLEGGNNAVLTIVDRLSKLVRLTPVYFGQSGSDAAAIAAVFFRRIIADFGLPEAIVADRDPRWTSKFWNRLAELMGTKLCLSSAFHPQSDG